MNNNKFYFSDLNSNVHSESFPSSFRMLIVGPSGCGKTSLLMKMLLHPNLLNYDKLFVFARSLYQPEYQVLRHGLENRLRKGDMIDLLQSEKTLQKHSKTIKELSEGMAEYNVENDIAPCEIECKFSEDGSEIPDPKDLDKSIRNLIVFDDIMTDRRQSQAENYYTRGRSANCDCIYLSQNYTRLPLHTIRSNANFMIFFKSSPLVVEQIHRNFVSPDIHEYKDFTPICEDAWQNKYGFLVIDLSRDYKSGHKYRKRLDV